MTKEQLHKIKHAYGADSENPGYREHYCTHISEDKDMLWLVENGYFYGPQYVGNFGIGHGMFYLTEKGKALAKSSKSEGGES